MSRTRLRTALLCAGVVLAAGGGAAPALTPRRTLAKPAAFSSSAAPRCVPSALNRSAQLPGTDVAVSPLPDSYDASPRTQISLLGAPAQALGALTVSGSSSGRHPGQLRAYSQGDGASFLPARPFSPGERVSVGGRVSVGAKPLTFAFHFVVAHAHALPRTPPGAPSGGHSSQLAHYHSRADLQPPLIAVGAHSAATATGYIFAAPYSGPGKAGPMIFDQAGDLVWFDPLPAGVAAANLQVQRYNGQPVLSWWQGYIREQGFGMGEEVIADSSYRRIARVLAGNGYSADLHDFHITAQNTALLSVFDPLRCNLAGVGGPSAGAVTDSVFQEIDLQTGLVRREWHSLDHVALGDSYSSAQPGSGRWPFDYFHINSIEPQPNGITLISARNTWALYQLNTTTGQVLARIGGRRSGVRLAAGAKTAYQHDAAVLPNGTISIFDNGAVPRVHAQSRGIVVALDPRTHTGSLVAQYEHPVALSAGSQGNLQLLANGDAFVGWGSQPFFSEFDPAGHLLFDARMHGSYQSYRGYRFPWAGAPAQAPAIAAEPSRHAASGAPTLSVFASWNGDTRTASWRVLGGPSAQALAPVVQAPRSGFETAIGVPPPQPFVAVQALDASGAVLGTSPAIPG